ncbi:hypothetical protein [Devosia sp. CN2-171]|uniref:hypothetical protein n=1 Tax=Devosia sp. CN2-171 TaxID=3400909 RepID=UPI003BF81192
MIDVRHVQEQVSVPVFLSTPHWVIPRLHTRSSIMSLQSKYPEQIQVGVWPLSFEHV